MLFRAILLWLSTVTLTASDPVLLVAIDGIRWDYLDKLDAPNLKALRAEGAHADRLRPQFPATTFPNFYSMATGLRPERHGIVAMSFYDPARQQSFVYKRNSREGFWYQGVPIWQAAEEQGIRTATYFFPGSDAAVNGRNPTYFRPYDPRATNEQRARQVVDWLQMPARERPGLIIVYFSEVDSKGHAYGPDATETHEALRTVDAVVGSMIREARAAAPRVNVVIASDHGMSSVNGLYDLTPEADWSGCRAANEAPMTMVYCADPSKREALFESLNGRSPDWTVYKRGGTPASWNFRANDRIGDLIIVPNRPAIVQVVIPGDLASAAVPPLKGMHGYDPSRFSEMTGILMGVGPAFSKGASVPEAQTVDVFALLVKLLGINTPEAPDAQPLDASWDRVKGLTLLSPAPASPPVR